MCGDRVNGQSTLQVTAIVGQAGPGARWWILHVVLRVAEPHRREYGDEPPGIEQPTALVAWPYSDGVRRHALDVRAGDVVALNGSLELYRGRADASGRVPPAKLGMVVRHLVVVSRPERSDAHAPHPQG